MLNEKLVKKIVEKNQLLEKGLYDTAVKEAKKQKKDLESYLIEKKLVGESALYEHAAEVLRLPFLNLKNQIIHKDILFLIPEPIALTHKILAFDKDAHNLKIVVTDPNDLQTFEFIRKKTGLSLLLHLATPSQIQEGLKQYHRSLEAEFQTISNPRQSEQQSGREEKPLAELAKDLPVIRIVDTLMEYAIFEGASDIHIDPEERQLVVRYRIDGILQDVMTLPKPVQSGLVARIKILSNLKIDEHRLPQDGRFKIETSEYKVAFRVSIIPVFDGEKVVMRLLNEKSQVLTLEQLGLQPKAHDIVKRNIKKPHGMILVTGPTGSGKTTTLYTILNMLNTPDVNISTIEDPIEYRMPRVNQSQVNPKIGFTFAGGLRAFLRQDPDIIMVGEIRDTETAEIAIHAAMTGHLVLSTLHTNDAVTTLPRLMEMEVPTFLVASTTNVIIGQRLVRKICQSCIQSYNLNTEDITELQKAFNIPSILKTLAREGIILNEKQGLDELLFYKGVGCKECNSTGYKGRIGIYEIFEITPEVSAMVRKHATREELLEVAIRQGMISMLEDGFIKAKSGITTLEEVLRVTKE